MTWAKLDDRLWDDPRVEQAGLEAFGLWARALSFVAARRAGGVITKQQLFALAGHKAHWLAQRLVDAGLWATVEPRSYRFVDGTSKTVEPAPQPHPLPPRVTRGVGAAPKTNPPPTPGGVAAPPFPSPPIDPHARAPISDQEKNSRSSSDLRSPDRNSLLVDETETLPLFAGVAIEPTSDPVAEVWSTYLAGREQAGLRGAAPLLDDKRRRLIEARLKQLPLEDVRDAAAGIWLDSWHVERRKVEPEYVFRDVAHVEQFRDVARRARRAEDGELDDPSESWPENQPGAVPPHKFPPPPPPPRVQPPETEEDRRRLEELRKLPLEEIKRRTAQTMGLWGYEHAFPGSNR